MKYVLTFASTHVAMKAARSLKSKKVDVLVIPIPRKISSECGIAIEVQGEEIEKVKPILEEEKCGVTGVYEGS